MLKQAFIGDEDFVEEAKRKAVNVSKDAGEGFYPLKRIVQAICKASGLVEEEIKRPGRSEGVQRARELLCYIARRRSDVGLRELTRFLGVKELSTPSHGVRRAERRMSQDQDFRRELERVLKLLRSSIHRLTLDHHPSLTLDHHQRARELLCYIARRRSDVGLRELTRFLGVKELSTPSLGVRWAERRMSQDQDFRRELERVLKLLRSSIQA